MNPLEKAWAVLKANEFGDEDEYSDEEYAQARARMKEIEEELTQQFAIGDDMNPSEEIMSEWDRLRPILQSRPTPKPPPKPVFESEPYDPGMVRGNSGEHKERVEEAKRKREEKRQEKERMRQEKERMRQEKKERLSQWRKRKRGG